MSLLRAAAKRFEANRPPGRLLGRDGAAPPMKATHRNTAGGLGVFRGHPLAIPLSDPTPPREKVSLRSPLSDGGNASSGTGVPVQEATTEGCSLSWVLIDKSLGHQQSSFPQGITTGSLVCGYHPYSSEYGAGTCPRVAEAQPFLFSPKFPGDGGKLHGTKPSPAGPTEEAHR